MRCPNCQSYSIETDVSRGDTFCTNCGHLLSENAIVSEVSFVEGAKGTLGVSGQFISSIDPGRSSRFVDLRGTTLTNGHKRIQQMASALRLSSHLVDATFRIYTLTVQHNFNKGRKTNHVIAACLYIVCRREKTPHMLLDFADLINANVYVLGSTYLKIVQLLNLRLPIVDPSLYIHRFAARLELEEKTQAVAMTALRLVARLKREWIQVGRNPAGICASCLLIAARMHGFRRTQREVVQAVRTSEVTLRQRLKELLGTGTSELTLANLEEIDVETESLRDEHGIPPSLLHEDQKSEDSATSNLTDEQIEQMVSSMIQGARWTDIQPDFATESNEIPTAHVPNPERKIEHQETSGKYMISSECTDIDDREIEEYICTEEEVAIKEMLWMQAHGAYMEKKAQLDQLEQAMQPERSNRTRQKKQLASEVFGEAVANVAKEKVSRKIDYSILSSLMDVDRLMDYGEP